MMRLRRGFKPVPARLTDQVVLPLVLLVGVASAVLFSYEYVSSADREREHLRETGARLVEHIDVIADTVDGEAGGVARLSRIVEHLALGPGVAGAYVVDGEGRVIAACDRAHVGGGVRDVGLVPLQDAYADAVAGIRHESEPRFEGGKGRAYVFALPFEDANGEPGAVIAVLDAGASRAVLTSALRRYAGSTLLGVALIALLAWLVVHVMALHPIARIVAALGDAGHGGVFTVRSRLPRNELATLADELTRLFAELKASRRETEELAAVVEKTGSLIALTDAAGKIVRANPAFEQFFGDGAGSLCGQSVWALLCIDDRATVSGGAFCCEIDMLQQDGGEAHLRVECQPLGAAALTDGGAAAAGAKLMFVATDLTDHRRLETDLQRAAARLTLATEGAYIGVWEWDIASGRLEWDERMLDLFGVAREDFRGGYLDWRDRVHPADLPKTEALLTRAVEGDAVFRCEFRVRRPDGVECVLHAAATVRRDESGEPLSVIGINQDITELHAARERLDLALRSANQGMWDWDLRDDSVVFNDVWYTMLGYEPGEMPMALQTWVELAHPDDLDACYEAIAAHKGGATAQYRSECRLRCKDGSYRWILDVGEVTERDAEGRPLRMVGVHIDIDDMRRKEEQLSASERRFRELFEIAPIGIALNDKKTGAFLNVNEAVAGPMELTREEVCERSFWEVTPAEYETAELEQLEIIEQHGRYGPYEKEYFRADGTRYPVLLRGVAVTDEHGRECIWSFIEDMTPRKEAERELLHRTTLLSSLLDSIPDLVFFKDLQGRYLGCNIEFERFVGRSRDEIVGNCDGEVFGDDGVGSFSAFGVSMFDEQSAQLSEEWVDHPESGRVLLATLKAPLVDPHGRVLGLLGVSRDVTERELARMRMDEARAQAEAANKSKSAFLANMSHEIRTPMTAILGFADLLLDPSTTDKERDQHVRTIRGNGEHLLSVINDILDISKIEAGKLGVERVETDVREIVGGVRSLLGKRAEDKGVGFRVEPVAGSVGLPSALQTDPVRLRQVLLNLVGNAVKFTERGSVTLRAGIVPGERVASQDEGSGTAAASEVVPEEGGGVLVFEIIDTGVGMTDEQIAALFKPFSQADVSTTRRFGGSGLGLVISKNLVEMLGGRIDVRSVYGKGSTFTVRLPVPADAMRSACGLSAASARTAGKAAPIWAPGTAAEPLAGVRVLLAEDGPDNQRLIGFLLRKAGATVTVAGNGRLAVEAVCEGVEAFDVVLMDMQMPELDGYGATRLLRERGVRLPIVALTAHAMSEDRDRCVAAGCDDYQTKPIDRDRLIAVVARWAGGDRTRKAG